MLPQAPFDCVGYQNFTTLIIQQLTEQNISVGRNKLDISGKVKGKAVPNRSGVAQRVPGGLDSQIS